jgi:hypothetical protein
MGVDYCPNIGGYIFRMHSRRIEIAKSVDDFDELKSAFYTNKLIEEEEIAEIYERYTVVYNYTPNIFAPGFSLNK